VRGFFYCLSEVWVIGKRLVERVEIKTVVFRQRSTSVGGEEAGLAFFGMSCSAGVAANLRVISTGSSVESCGCSLEVLVELLIY